MGTYTRGACVVAGKGKHCCTCVGGTPSVTHMAQALSCVQQGSSKEDVCVRGKSQLQVLCARSKMSRLSITPKPRREQGWQVKLTSGVGTLAQVSFRFWGTEQPHSCRRCA